MMALSARDTLIALLIFFLLIVCLFSAARYRSGSSDREYIAEIPETRIAKVPEKYKDDFSILLGDYYEKKITADEALSILILKMAENDGVFLPLYETDTRFDYYLVSKERRKEIEAAPKLYQKKSLKK